MIGGQEFKCRIIYVKVKRKVLDTMGKEGDFAAKNEEMNLLFLPPLHLGLGLPVSLQTFPSAL